MSGRRDTPEISPTLPIAANEPEQLRRLGRYPVVDKLGEGGMAQVWLVEDEQLRRQVAAKILPDDRDPVTRSKFVLEAQVTGQLEHPNIVPVYELGQEEGGGPLYFTMKRVAGRTLEEILEERAESPGEVSLLALLQIFLKICDALRYAHSKGVIHRDLKPGNVMVGRFGETQVMDWGLAKVVGQPDHVADRLRLEQPANLTDSEVRSGHLRTLAGTVMGTPEYMSPEQAAGAIDSLDERTDIYALGAILYELLAGVPPYSGESVWTVIDQVTAGPPPPPRVRAPWATIPWELEAVVVKAMSAERADRYPSVEALQRDVVRFLEGGTLAAVRYRPWQRLGKWVVRHRVAVVLGLLLTAMAVGGVWSLRQAAARWKAEAHGQRLSEQSKQQEDALRLARRREHLRRQLAALSREIETAQPFFYIRGISLKTKLHRVEQSLLGLERLAPEAKRLKMSALFTQLGAGWIFLGQERKGRGALAQALLLSPDDRQAHLLLARLYLRQAISAFATSYATEWRRVIESYVGKAREHLRRAGAARGGEERLGRHLARTYIAWAEQRTELVERMCREGLDRFGDMLGSEAYHLIRSMGLQGEARVKALELALDRRPSYDLALFLRGHTKHNAQRYAAAVADYSAALEVNRHFVYAYHSRSGSRRALRRYREALADSDAAIRMVPGWSLPYNGRALAKEQLGDIKGALADLAEAFRLNPRLAEPLVNRGRIHAGQGHTDAALADYTLALKVNPRLAGAYINRGLLLQRLGRGAQALRDLDAAVRITGEAGAYFYRGWVYYSQRRYDRALADYDEAIRRFPQYAEAYVNRAVIKQLQRRWKEALADYDQAVRHAPRSVQALTCRGGLLRMLGQHRRSHDDLSRALRLAPRSGRARVERGQTLLSLKRPQEAATDFRLAIKINPRDRQAHQGLGQALQALGELKAAIAAYSHAIRLAPGYAVALANRGAAYLASGKPALAERDLRSAVRGTKSWQVWLLFGQSLARQGNKQGAREAFSRARQLVPAASRKQLEQMIARELGG